MARLHSIFVFQPIVSRVLRDRSGTAPGAGSIPSGVCAPVAFGYRTVPVGGSGRFSVRPFGRESAAGGSGQRVCPDWRNAGPLWSPSALPGRGYEKSDESDR